MTKIVAIFLMAAFLCSGATVANAQNSPVTILPDNPTSKTTTIVTDQDAGTTKIVVEEEPAVYDAITGELVDPKEALKKKPVEPESLRDEVRGKMTE